MKSFETAQENLLAWILKLQIFHAWVGGDRNGRRKFQGNSTGQMRLWRVRIVVKKVQKAVHRKTETYFEYFIMVFESRSCFFLLPQSVDKPV